MSFKILNSEGEAINIHELDAEAAAFWDKEVDEKWYATPFKPLKNATMRERMDHHRMNNNWFDTIGWQIHYKQCTTWDEVRINLIGPNLVAEYGYKMVAQTYLPWLSLISYWEQKGYKPVFVDEKN